MITHKVIIMMEMEIHIMISYGSDDRYQQSYAYENATGRDEYGNPTYG